MGLLDTLRSALGLSAEVDATRRADPADLFGMSTAYVTMEADLGYAPVGEAALCFSGVDSTSFEDAREEVRQILEAGVEETGTDWRYHDDRKGYQWVILADDDFEDLITSLHFAADTFVEAGFGSRLLAAVFGFRKTGSGRDAGARAYWIYSFRRGAYYPFAPREGTRERDPDAEFKLESVLDGELDVEPEKEFWYPLWPDGDGHPWES